MSLFTKVASAAPDLAKSLPSSSSSSSGSGGNTGNGLLSQAPDLIKKAESVITNAESSVGKIFSAGESSLSDATKSITSSLFGDSSTPNTQSGAVKTPIPDPVSSNFASGTPPKASIFKTTNATTALTPTNLTGQTSSADTSILGRLPSLIKRYGSDIITDVDGGIHSAISSTLKNSVVQGLFSDISAVSSTVSTARTAVSNVITAGENVISTGVTDFRQLVTGLARDLTGNELGLDGMFNPSLPTTAGVNGEAIDGVPTNVSTSTLSSIVAAAKGLGCEAGNIGLNAYGAGQSLFAGLLGLASELNFTSILKNLLNCNRMDTNMQSVGAGLFVNYAGSNASVANTLITSIPTTAVPLTQPLKRAVVTNPNVTTTADVSDVKSIMSTLNFTAADAMSSGVSIDGQTVYDTSVLDAMTDPLLTAIDPTGGSLSVMQNGTPLNSATV